MDLKNERNLLTVEGIRENNSDNKSKIVDPDDDIIYSSNEIFIDVDSALKTPVSSVIENNIILTNGDFVENISYETLTEFTKTDDKADLIDFIQSDNDEIDIKPILFEKIEDLKRKLAKKIEENNVVTINENDDIITKETLNVNNIKKQNVDTETRNFLIDEISRSIFKCEEEETSISNNIISNDVDETDFKHVDSSNQLNFVSNHENLNSSNDHISDENLQNEFNPTKNLYSDPEESNDILRDKNLISNKKNDVITEINQNVCNLNENNIDNFNKNENTMVQLKNMNSVVEIDFEDSNKKDQESKTNVLDSLNQQDSKSKIETATVNTNNIVVNNSDHAEIKTDLSDFVENVFETIQKSDQISQEAIIKNAILENSETIENNLNHDNSLLNVQESMIESGKKVDNKSEDEMKDKNNDCDDVSVHNKSFLKSVDSSLENFKNAIYVQEKELLKKDDAIKTECQSIPEFKLQISSCNCMEDDSPKSDSLDNKKDLTKNVNKSYWTTDLPEKACLDWVITNFEAFRAACLKSEIPPLRSSEIGTEGIVGLLYPATQKKKVICEFLLPESLLSRKATVTFTINILKDKKEAFRTFQKTIETRSIFSKTKAVVVLAGNYCFYRNKCYKDLLYEGNLHIEILIQIIDHHAIAFTGYHDSKNFKYKDSLNVLKEIREYSRNTPNETVIINCANLEHQASKFLLQARSKRFRQLLSHNTKTITIKDVNSDILQQVLQFIHTNSCYAIVDSSITDAKLIEMLTTCNSYGIKSLFNIICGILANRIQNNNVLLFRDVALMCSDENELYLSCVKYLDNLPGSVVAEMTINHTKVNNFNRRN